MKTVIITGTTKGIGLATAKKFLEEGYKVIGTGRTSTKIDHKNYEHYSFNVGNSQEVESFYKDINKEIDNVELLVNNAGIGWPTPIDECKTEDWDEMMRVNVNGVFYMAKGLVPSLKKARRGHIINISSTAGKIGIETMSAYCATKFAVRGLTQSWYKELRPLGIKVTSIHPGSVQTNFFDTFDNVQANESMMKPSDIASSIWHAFNSDANYHMIEIEMRPLQPK